MSGPTRPSLAAITLWGLGHIRPAPGTWGSLPPVFAAAVIAALGFTPATTSWLITVFAAVALVVFTLVCAVQGDAAEARWGRKDPSEAVADETAGQCVPLLFLPAFVFSSPGMTVFTLAYAFLAFRVFDILKPWPARQVQTVPGGWGIVLDDLFAGLQAALLLQLIIRVVV
jgi:phosphatidylglycerophosphatase A